MADKHRDDEDEVVKQLMDAERANRRESRRADEEDDALTASGLQDAVEETRQPKGD